MTQYKRVYVEVEVQFISDGSMRPRALIWRDENTRLSESWMCVLPARRRPADRATGIR